MAAILHIQPTICLICVVAIVAVLTAVVILGSEVARIGYHRLQSLGMRQLIDLETETELLEARVQQVRRRLEAATDVLAELAYAVGVDPPEVEEDECRSSPP